MPIDLGRTAPILAPGVEGLLSHLIHERIGIVFEPDRQDLMIDKLRPVVERSGCPSYLDFYYRLKYEERGPQDWVDVLDALSVQETYFWREMDQIHAFVNHIVPAWFSRTTSPLRVWCAACATGEEPLTLVMALAAAGWGNHPIEIVASDGSAAALEKAREGVYREKSFRTLPLHMRQTYFKPVEGGSKIDPVLSRRVTYSRANLLAGEEISSLARAHVIFCRNVFIYFSSHAIRQTLATFAARMPPRSHLFVGVSESLLRLTGDFELVEIGGAFVYVRQ